MSQTSFFIRVLLVDDHPDLLSMLGLMMTRRNYRVETALSGSQALQIAPDFAPHIVISDIGMPQMDGFELMLQLRATDIPPFRAIALSGYDFETDAEIARALEAGYDAHLRKPIEFDQLFGMIEEFARELDYGRDQI